MSRIKTLFKRFFKAVESTVLCIRYPYLYPRNRFTGLHYNNWKLHDYISRQYKNAVKCIFVKPVNMCDLCEDRKSKMTDDIILENGSKMSFISDIDGNVDIIVNGKSRKTIDTWKYTDDFSPGDAVGFYDCKSCIDLYIVYPDNVSINLANTSKIYNVIVDRWAYLKRKIAIFLKDYVLQLFHCIPTYTEWDALKSYEGWYKAFGKELLKDIDKQLRKDKMRTSWRIMDIKEKYGSLRLYCNFGTNEMYRLLERYEDLSYHTCIECGKPAKYLTGGYILPYCEDHFNINEEIPYATADKMGKWVYKEEA